MADPHAFFFHIAQVPHFPVKPICFSEHTKEPAWHMPHCCVYKEGFHAVDENFEPVGANGKPCWRQVILEGAG